jgi:hypothetical protein
VGRVDEACGLGVVDHLRECVMEESFLDVELVHEPTPREHQSEHSADDGGFHHGTESLIEVHARALGEHPEDPTCLVPIKRPVNLKPVPGLMSCWTIGAHTPLP